MNVWPLPPICALRKAIHYHYNLSLSMTSKAASFTIINSLHNRKNPQTDLHAAALQLACGWSWWFATWEAKWETQLVQISIIFFLILYTVPLFYSCPHWCSSPILFFWMHTSTLQAITKTWYGWYWPIMCGSCNVGLDSLFITCVSLNLMMFERLPVLLRL